MVRKQAYCQIIHDYDIERGRYGVYAHLLVFIYILYIYIHTNLKLAQVFPKLH